MLILPTSVICFRQRCAILTFQSAELAIAAHCSTDYVRLGIPDNKKDWAKVLYRYGEFFKLPFE